MAQKAETASHGLLKTRKQSWYCETITGLSGIPTIDAIPGPDTERGEPSAERISPTKTLRARLRDETRAAHERLDASFAALSEGNLRDYAMFLQVNAACLAVVEPLVAKGPLPAAMPGFRYDAGRAEAAKADLEAMALAAVAVPRFPILAPTLAQATGMSYVIEGSRLGARMILKGLRKSVGGEPKLGFATSFLESAGEPERFREFLGLAEAIVVTKSDRDAAVTAADATFAYFADAVRAVRAANDDGGAN